MKKIIFSLIALAVVAGCAKKEEAKPEAKVDAETKSATDWKVSRNTEGETVVTLDTNTQARIQLKVESPAAVKIPPEIKGFGRVMDPAPLVDAVTEIASTGAAAKASAQEFERVKNLAAQNNASARALQTAEAAATHDQLAAQSAQTKFALAWGKSLAQRENLAEFIKSLALGEALLIRLDLPAGEILSAPPKSATVFSLADAGHPVTAEFLDAAASVEPQSQGRGFLFLVKQKTSALAPGAAVAGFLQLAGEPVGGVLVSRDAILRRDGATWIYLQTGENDFTRRRVMLERPMENGWLVHEGLHESDKIVTVGAQTLLSQELSAAGFQSGDRD